MALHEVERGHGTACGGEGTWHCVRWGGDMALHVVERGQGTACCGEGTRHCMWWGGEGTA